MGQVRIDHQMKLTKQQKVIIGIFALALLGLVCDRVFLLPRQARANAKGSVQTRDSGLILAVNPIPEEQTEGMGLKDRLNERLPDDMIDVSQVRDAFTPSSDWLAVGGAAGTKPVVEDLDFKRKYQIQAIVFQDDLKAVFVNDKVVRVGDTIDGYELVKLSEKAATFSVDGIWTEVLLDR